MGQRAVWTVATTPSRKSSSPEREVGKSDGSLASESHQVAMDEHVHPLLFALYTRSKRTLLARRAPASARVARAAGVNPPRSRGRWDADYLVRREWTRSRSHGVLPPRRPRALPSRGSERLTLIKGLAFVGRELDQWERERAGWQKVGSKRQPPSRETPAEEPLKPQQGPSAELRALLAEHDENGDRAPAPPVDAGWDAPS